MAAAQRPPMSYEDVDERPQWWDVSAYVATYVILLNVVSLYHLFAAARRANCCVARDAQLLAQKDSKKHR